MAEDTPSVEDIMSELRRKVQRNDNVLMMVLEQRFTSVRMLWEYKKARGEPFRDSEVEQKVITDLANSSDLSYEFVEKMYRTIFDENDNYFNKKGT